VTLVGEGEAEHRRLLFATGVSDSLPEVEGLAERWGKSVFQCPYCHGCELEQGKLGVIATGVGSLHEALFLPEWGGVTLMANGALTLSDSERAELIRRGVEIEETPTVSLGRQQYESGHCSGSRRLVCIKVACLSRSERGRSAQNAAPRDSRARFDAPED
jgi:thioredoxin reductase